MSEESKMAPPGNLANADAATPKSAATRWSPDQPPSFEGDGEGYPTDEWLDALAAHKMDFRAAARFLVEGFPAACAEIACCRVTVTDAINDFDDPGIEIEFVTGGWSGAEALIGTMLADFSIKHFHRRWEAGGLYVFFVPAILLDDGAGNCTASSTDADRDPGMNPDQFKATHP